MHGAQLTPFRLAVALWAVFGAMSPSELILAQPVSSAGQAPARPRGQSDIASAEVQVLRVQGNIYMLVGPSSNVTLQIEPSTTRPPRVPGDYRGGYGALLVDTGAEELGDRVLAAVRELTEGPVRYIFNTHIHADHIGGNEILADSASGEGAFVLAHENVLLQLAQPRAGEPDTSPGALPTDSYLDVKELWFNGESIQIFHQPNAHTDGDSIVYFRRSDVISAGDIFTTTTYPVIDRSRGGSLDGVIASLNRILDIAIPESNQEGGTRIIPGHGRLADEADVVEYRNMLVIIQERIEEMVKKGMTLAEVKAARPSLDYDFRYGTSPAWTTDMFVEAVYQEVEKTVASTAPSRAERVGLRASC